VDLHQNLNSVSAWRQAHRSKTFQIYVWRVWAQHNQLLGDKLCKPGVGSLLLDAFPLGSGMKYYLWRKLCKVVAYMYFTSTIVKSFIFFKFYFLSMYIWFYSCLIM
jgi:hypothetical protein